MMQIWECKIGETTTIPKGADGPMREAVELAYEAVTGERSAFIFSGWNGKLTASERDVVEDRDPTPLVWERPRSPEDIGIVQDADGLVWRRHPAREDSNLFYDRWICDDPNIHERPNWLQLLNRAPLREVR